MTIRKDFFLNDMKNLSVVLKRVIQLIDKSAFFLVCMYLHEMGIFDEEYKCPLCMQSFSDEQILNNFTVKDVPQKSLGGERILLIGKVKKYIRKIEQKLAKEFIFLLASWKAWTILYFVECFILLVQLQKAILMVMEFCQR